MSETTAESVPTIPSWPSIDSVEPSEEGGAVARAGFNYQDEIAVSFLIEMLESDSLVKVHCETHDDIVLVRHNGPSQPRLAEYVQVKAGEPNKLWSVADMSARKKGQAGTSIFEISLGRDKCEETSTFRIVTLRQAAADLKLLTNPCGAIARAMESDGMKALCAEFDKRFPGVKSPKGNGCSFWLENCLWDERHTEEAVRKTNALRLIKLSVLEKKPILPEQAELFLDELRVKAKEAGAAKWKTDPSKKIISREAICAWWQRRLDALANDSLPSGGKLTAKMSDAQLPDDVVALATSLRRDYAAASRTSRYLEPDEAQTLQQRVQSEVMSLRSRFVAGELNLSAAQFHALCLERMDAVNAERDPSVEDRSAFLKGCMYDIADRCLLRFARTA